MSFTDRKAIVSGTSWRRSDPLITRSSEDQFQLMYAAGLGGDSVMLTLQRRTRIKGEDAIETHTFVNHCPSGNPLTFKIITQHYESTLSPKHLNQGNPPITAPD